jgi:methionyl aminopeptidase
MEDQLVELKDAEWIANQRTAGKCVAAILGEMSERIGGDRTYTGKELEGIAESIFPKFNCTATFLGYKGFPSSICLSVNKELVHGIPKNLPILDGDVVSFDLGATHRGSIADAAVTVIKGKAKDPRHDEIISVCKKALMAGIGAVKIGEPIGTIGYAIHNLVKRTPYSIVHHYGGHGINTDTPHAQPFVHNKSQKTEGVRVQVGMTIAIEPMVMIGSTETKVLSDGWTVMGNGISAHFEHSIAVTENGIQIQTLVPVEF